MKKITIIIIILLIAGVVFWMFKSKTNSPVVDIGEGTIQQNNLLNDIDIPTINEDINSIDIGNPDQEFKDVEADLNKL